jgi:tRNA(fMet)-specific endonuclease VapC
MPLTHLLDTNIVSYFVRGNFPAVRQHIARAPIDSLAVSIVTKAELLYWVLCRPGSTRIHVGVADFPMRAPSITWDTRAAQNYARTRDTLKRNGLVLSTKDLMIVPQALSLV